MEFTWFILGALAVLVVLVGVGWRETVKEQRRRAQATAPRSLGAGRTWEESFNPDGSVFITLKMTMHDGRKECTGTVGIDIPKGPLARDVRERIRQRRADLVESCLGWDMRSPDVIAFAGEPKRKEQA